MPRLIKTPEGRELWELICDHANGRLKRETTDWIHAILNLERIPTSAILVRGWHLGKMVAVAGCLCAEEEVKHSFLVTHADYRSRGYARTLLRIKREELQKRGVQYLAVVADDNEASKAVMRHNGLCVAAVKTATRERGEYRVLEYCEGEK